MMQVFIPLSNLRNLEFQHTVNRHALSRLRINIPANSAFYADARKHLSKQVRNNIDKLLERFSDYNGQIDAINPTMTSRINEIINPAMPGPLDERFVPSIYQIIRDAFQEVILTPEGSIEDALRNHDMRRKVHVDRTGAYGFTGQEQRAINILNTIEANTQIRQELQGLRNRIIDIRSLIDNISSQASGIIQEIHERRYHKKRLCCPSLIKELWRSFI